MKMGAKSEVKNETFGASFEQTDSTFDADFPNVGGGQDGKDGATFIPSVSKEGIISWTNNGNLPNPTPVNIKGEKGEKGADGKDGADGRDGVDGKTPYIQDGYWYINGVNTNVKAEGVDGNDGYTPQKNVDYFDGKDGKSAYEYAKEGGFKGTEAEFAQKIAKEIPSKVSQLENDSKFLTEVPSEYVTETELNNKGYLTEHQSLADYAKKSELPTKTSQLTNDSGFLTEHQSLADYAKKSELPSKTSELTNDSGFIKSSEAPVQSVNGKTGAVSLSATDVSARPNTWTPTYSDVGAEKSGAVVTHNTNTESHNDIRIELKALADRINAVLDSDDTTLDELSEIVAYIKSNKALIDGVTTSKVNVSDIINNLTSNVTNKPLSAAQGVTLKKLIDAIAVPTKVSELDNDSGFLTSIPSEYVTDTELNNKGYLTEHQSLADYAKKSELPTKTSQLTNDSKFLTSVPSEYVTETELSGKGYAVKSSAETWTFKLKDGSTVTKKVVLA